MSHQSIIELSNHEKGEVGIIDKQIKRIQMTLLDVIKYSEIEFRSSPDF
jgi:hypothetical protein